MHPDKNALSIRLTEPVVPLRTTPERSSRENVVADEVLPPAILRGLLTLKLAKPTKISSIELELQAKATTDYVQHAGPSRIDVTEQYEVHSTSTAVFKADPSQERRRATSTRPRVQFMGDQTVAGIRHAGFASRQSQTLGMRSASLDPLSHRFRRQLSSNSDELQIDYGRNQRNQTAIHVEPAPPYPSSADDRSLLSVDLSGTGRSPSIASNSRLTDPRSSPNPFRNSPTRDAPYGLPTSNAHTLRDMTLSRTSSIGEIPEDETESFDTTATRPDSIEYYGLSRVATGSSRSSEQDGRGRSHSRFSFDKVVHAFEAVKNRVRSRSPPAGSLDDQEERGRSLTKGKGKTHFGVGHALPQIGVIESAAGHNEQSGDGWVVFSEGTYTYPVFFTIPNNSPPTMRAEHGSLVWTIKAQVKRPGAFNRNMTAQKEVIVVSVPKDDNSVEVEGVDLQQQWEDQLQYRIQVAGRGFPISGKIPLQLTVMPLTKAKLHSISVHLDERTEYFTRVHSQARTDSMRRTTLLMLKNDGFDDRHGKPILPLTSDDPDAFRKSPLHRLLRPGEDESELASSFMGRGPWIIRHQLQLPDSCSNLYPSNRTKGSNIIVNHTLRLVLRVEKDEGTGATGKKKLHDIVIHIPVQILSCRCTSEWTSLPRYGEALRSGSNSPEDSSSCPCRSRHRMKMRTHSHGADAFSFFERGSSHPASSNSPGGADPDSLANRTHLYEQLMSGLVSETGEAPPSYERVETVHL